jgi:hypothetical protein
MPRGRRQLELMLILAAGIGCARAPEPAVPSMAEYCNRLVREFKAPASHSVYRSALSNLMSCPKEGVPLLVSLWTTPPADDSTLEAFLTVAGTLRDGRLYAGARRIAQDPDRPSRERLAALRALVPLYNPWLFAHDWGHPADPGAPANSVSIGQYSHPSVRHGAVGMPANVGDQITELYADLAQTDPNAQVRYIAKVLHRGILHYRAGERVP